MEVAQILKIVLIGDGTVGKTAIRKKFIDKTFTPNYLMTIGSDFAIYEMSVENVGQIVLQIWDLAGQPHFTVVRNLYYQGCKGALLVYDVSNPITFQNVPGWLAELEKNVQNVPICLVGNKIDLRDQVDSAITTEEGVELAEQLTQEGREIIAIETSAVTGEGIKKAFSELTKLLVQNL
ncbi:MAG: Rab family GTPase [Candidatus Hermodarchaeota archaeon]